MPTVAVAGGTGKLGRTMVEVLLENPGYNVVVLSRKSSEAGGIKTPIILTDYNNIDDLQNIFESHSVESVISTIQVNSEESGLAEQNLIDAAARSASTKRFIASDWAVEVPDTYPQLASAAPRRASIAKLRTTDLEWTTIANGIIMDHFGTPYLKSHMGVAAIHMDIENKTAAIPGTGDDVICFSYSYDIARFVEKALQIPKWNRTLACWSDRCTYNDVVRAAEETLGEKFDVSYNDISELERGEMSELPLHKSMYSRIPKSALQARFATFGLYCVGGLFNLPEEQSLNATFPEIKPKSVMDIIASRT